MIEKNIEWYGTLPKNWSTPKMSYVCNTITDYTASGSFASLAENVIYRDTEDYAMLVRTADLSKKRDINPVFIDEKAYNFLNNSNLFGGELIMSNVGSVGDVYLYEPLYQKASLAPNAIMVRANGYEKFLFYLFSTKQAVEGLLSITNTTTQPKFNKTQLRSFRVPFPDQLTMEKIVKHLDKKTKQIEDIKNKLSEEIESLENYKKSVITEAVTKGLDKNVEMKDSGIEWIGEIPKHWEVKRIKNLGNCRNGLTYSPLDICDEKEGTLVLRSSNVKDGKIVLNNNIYVNTKIPKKLMVKDGDILICSRNGSKDLIGKNAIINNIDATFGAFMMIYRSKNPKLMYYLLNSNIFYYYLGTFFTSTINQLTNANFENMKIVWCENDSEQDQIVDYLDKKTKLINDSIAIKQKQLETLEEYKKSLIYEYVTGKKEVEDGEES